MVAGKSPAVSPNIAGKGYGDVAPAAEMTSCEDTKARTAKRMMDDGEGAWS